MKKITKDKCYDWYHLLQTFREIVDPNMTVVEIGSSNSQRTRDLSRYCKKLIGVEKFPERIPRKSASINNIKIIEGDWHDLSKIFPSNSIDIIIASHVIEHVENDVKCLNESFKVLRGGGYLLFNTPNRKRLARGVIELFTGEKKFPYWEHVREYIRPDLENLIKKSNFSYQKVKIEGIVLGVHGGGFRLFIKGVSSFFDKFSNFWEVLIQK